MQLAAGTIFDDRYEILSAIGVGGMGNVYRARQLQFDRIVALKILDERIASDPDALARFEREAVATNALKHRNIVLFYAYGVWRQTPYMVMECVEGRSLESVLAEQSRLQPGRALDIAQQICQALDCAHEHGIIHRDLKPSNVILAVGPDGRDLVKVIDFGLAKVLPAFGKEVQKLTEAGSAVGSVRYMSPEQCYGQGISNKSDIYAAGCILFECLAGRPVFEGDHTVVIMQKHVSERPPSLAEAAPDVTFPPGLQTVIDQALAKDPDARYSSALAMIKDLNQVAAGRGVDKMQIQAPVETAAAQCPKRPALRKPVLIMAMFACCAVMLAAYLAMPSMHSQRRGERASVEYYSHSLEENLPAHERKNLLLSTIRANRNDAALDSHQLAIAYAHLVLLCVLERDKGLALQAARDALFFIDSTPLGEADREEVVAECARAFALCNRSAEERDLLGREIARHPNSEHVNVLRYLLGGAYNALGENEAAEKCLQKIRTHPGDDLSQSIVAEQIGMCQMAAGKYAEALQTYQKVSGCGRQAPGGLALSTARAEIRLGKMDEARRYLALSAEDSKQEGLGPIYDWYVLRAICDLHTAQAQNRLSEACNAVDQQIKSPQPYPRYWLERDCLLCLALAKNAHVDAQPLQRKVEELRQHAAD